MHTRLAVKGVLESFCEERKLITGCNQFYNKKYSKYSLKTAIYLSYKSATCFGQFGHQAGYKNKRKPYTVVWY
jgi:hypothetical protein